MNLKNLNSIVFIIAASLCMISCKKDKETTIPPSLDGTLTFFVPAYIYPESEIKMMPSGVEHPDGKELGYYWKVTPSMSKPDTTRYENGLDKNGNPSDGSFSHTFSDTLRRYTIYAYAFASGYSYASSSAYSTVVKGGVDGSITNLGLKDKPAIEVNGISYPYITVGSTDWITRNIAAGNAGAPYRNCKAMDDVFGRYYSYEEALEVCPEGWQLPTEEDWLALAAAAGAKETKPYDTIEGIASALMGNGYFNEELMWEYWPEVGDITNSTGFSAIPAGYATLGTKDGSAKVNEYIDYNYPQALFKGYTEYATFWTRDLVEGESGMAYYRYMISTQPDIMTGKGDVKSFGASVRCVRKK